MTPLDIAHADMEDDASSDTARLRFFERLAECELFLLLEKEASGSEISPMVFPVDDTQFVVAFDLEDRLAEFSGKPAPYAAISGRVLVEMIGPQNIGLGLNLEVAPSSILIPPDAIVWLQSTLSKGPSEAEMKPDAFAPPKGLPDALLVALDSKLSTASGLAKSAYLTEVSYKNGVKGHLLAFINPLQGAENALARAVNEALVFSGIEAGQLDVGFFAVSDPIAAKLARVGLRFDLPQVAETTKRGPSAPGRDPNAPPILR